MTPHIDLGYLEKLMRLMLDYEVDGLSVHGLSIHKSRHKPPAAIAPLDEHVALAQHLSPLTAEPWNAIPQEVVDEWAEKGSP